MSSKNYFKDLRHKTVTGSNSVYSLLHFLSNPVHDMNVYNIVQTYLILLKESIKEFMYFYIVQSFIWLK